MVIRILLFVVLLFPTLGFTADNISPQLDSLKMETLMRWRATGAVTDQLTSARVQSAINEAIQVVCDDFPAIVKFDTIILSTDSMGAMLNTDFNRFANVFRLDSVLMVPLKILEENDVDTFINMVIPTDFEHKQGVITSPHTCFAAGNRFMTYPRYTTDTEVGDSFFVSYYANDVKLDSGTDSTQILPRYRLAIIYYSISILYAELGQFEQSMAFMQFYASLVQRRSDVKGILQ